jgi:two-component system phosphate regulon response regulator OmpR
MNPRILIIDDDERLSAMLSTYLSARDFDVATEADGASGVAGMRHGSFDAAILDVMLPDFDGFEVLKRIRVFTDAPVLMLTGRGDADDRIAGLELGADDYLAKPFDPREVVARLHAILRRRVTVEPSLDVLEFGRLNIDKAARRVSVGGAERRLTGYQYDLLLALAERAGRVLTRDQIMQSLRGHDLDSFDRSIDVHISRIRAAIEHDPKQPRRILTVRGVGYVFAAGDDEAV